MDFILTFIREGHKKLVDDDLSQEIGLDFIDDIRSTFPSYRNLDANDIFYTNVCGIGSVETLYLTEKEARECGRFNGMSNFLVTVNFQLNEYLTYTSHETWERHEWFPFIKKLNNVHISHIIDKVKLYNAWKDAGCPKEWTK